MATLKNPRYVSPQGRPTMSNCPPLPACPACGGLQCLCRPRFFAGQILTEADLNRLEQYVIDKNRLHNRYLHGWGVVCGLVVSCNPCSDRVNVSAGYALSPCGDDIIVCADDTTPICDLIRQCRPASNPFGDCPPPTGNVNNDCQEATQDWILAICYNETTGRGVTPLRNNGSTSGSRCSCGGSSATGCGCSSKKTVTGMNGCTPSTPNPPAQCQPTLTCEGYTFIAYKAPPQADNDNPRTKGGLTNRVLACFQNIIKGMPPVPTGDNATPPRLQQWCCAFKQWLRDVLTAQAPSQCALFDLLGSLQCPDANQFRDTESYQKALTQTLGGYVIILAYLLRDCICNALLPHCPAPVDCNCVPLATITVRGSDCKILSVCNWGARRFVLTFPDIIDWLEPTGIFDKLGQLIERLCCGDFDLREFALRTTATATANPAATVAEGITPFAALLGQTWLNRDQNRPIDARALALAFLGATDTTGQPFATPFEMANPLAFLAVNQTVRPLLQAALPAEWTQLLVALGTQKATGAATPAASQDDLAALKKAVDDLRTTVQIQADEIARLKTR